MNKNKTAMIWGASGGIGQALVQALIDREWQVIAIGRQESPFNGETADQRIQYIEITSISAESSIQTAVMEASYEIDQIDLWIYTAGDIISSPVAEMDLTTWQRIMDANLTGAYLTAKHSIPLLAEKAHLMFLGAVNERLRLPGLSAYAAAKAGLEAYADALRKELRRKPVSVIRPGAVVTPLWEKVPMKLPKDAMTPEKLANKMLEAYENKHKGLLDLTH